MTGGVNPVIQQWMAGMTSQQLSQFIPTITVTEGEISHYVINRASQAAARAQEAAGKLAAQAKKPASAEKDKDKAKPSSSGEPKHKRPASPELAKAVGKTNKEIIQPMETSSPNSSPGASEVGILSHVIVGWFLECFFF